MRWLWLGKTPPEKSWAVFDITMPDKTKAMFQISVSTSIGDGRPTLFWLDCWIDGQAVQDIAPALMLFVRHRRWRKHTIKDALQQNNWMQDIIGGLPVLVTWQFLLLSDVLSLVNLQSGDNDLHTWTPCPSRVFSSKSAYQRFFVGGVTFEPHKRLWLSWAPLKVKIFIWLAAWRRCWTSDRLTRRRLPHSDTYPLCDQQQETIDHILVSCVFTREVWLQVLRGVHLDGVAPSSQEVSFLDWWRRACKRVTRDRRKGLSTLVMLVAWETWKR